MNIPEDKIDLDGKVGFNPSMAPEEILRRWPPALIHGVGYADSPRSHFRSMDIWHTCEPNIIGTEGWLGRALQELIRARKMCDGRELGPSMFRAMSLPGVPVACVSGSLETRHAAGHPG